jgi:structural maintenance of chromosome 4
VFGFKAKKLRQGKLSDLIHNSKDFPNLDRCSVEIIFKEIIDTDTGFLEIPGSEFSVMRSVKKSTTDTSAYHVDGVLKTYKQVQELLKGFGVDLDHKRFLILQVALIN